VVLIYGLHSLVDWTWFIPGDGAVALVCAGWLAGRGALGAPEARRRRPRSLTGSPGLAMAMLAIVALLVAGAWEVAAPLRSAHADGAAIGALTRGDSGGALTDARRAVAADPLALDPLYELSSIYLARGNPPAARAELLDAVSLQPQNPSPWQALGSFDLQQHHLGPARAELERALALDPQSVAIKALVAQARGEA
jgi:Tfp pilus assembly protein PilF